jgi:hypothetical protein
VYLYLSCLDPRIDHIRVTLDDRTHHADDRFNPYVLDHPKCAVVHNDLRYSVGISEIDEDHPAVVALAKDPTGQNDLLTDVGAPEF